MKDFLDKLSSYHLFNFLLPGTLFAILAEKITSYSFIQSDLILAFFDYYFLGLVISRFGSLVLEPILKKIRFVQFEPYKDFLAASKKDEKLELLSEINNTYRTLIAMLVLLILLKLYELTELPFPILSEWNTYFLIIGLLVLFLFSYAKQTEYINKRVKSGGKK